MAIQNLGKMTEGAFNQLKGGVQSGFRSLGKMSEQEFGFKFQRPGFGRPGVVLPGKVGEVQEKVSEFLAPESEEEAIAQSALDFSPLGLVGKVEQKVAPKVFSGFKDLTTKVLERLKGKSVTSKQEILDFTNMPELKQAERDLIRNVVGDFDKDIPVQEFANKVKTELLPLKRQGSSGNKGPFNTQYENITLSEELRGPVANYSEHIYESPIKTSAGEVHFRNEAKIGQNYFAHTRIEDLPAKPTKESLSVGEFMPEEYAKEPTRRVIEIQSDLFQKGRLEEGGLSSMSTYEEIGSTPSREVSKNWTDKDWANLEKQREQAYSVAKKEMGQLEPYRNTWHERVIREEVKQAAKDGKTKLQFPTGETAMKIEGLGETQQWNLFGETRLGNRQNLGRLATDDLKVGQEITQGDDIHDVSAHWIITRVDGDGKFQAIPRNTFESIAEESGKYPYPDDAIKALENNTFNRSDLQTEVETFDISGKVDTNNPIYKFYEKEVGRYLKNKYGAEMITDPQGVKWWQLDVKKEQGRLPIEAFGFVSLGIMTEEKFQELRQSGQQSSGNNSLENR